MVVDGAAARPWAPILGAPHKWRAHARFTASLISEGNEEIVTNERYVVMPWKMVTRCDANMTLKEAVEENRPARRIGGWFLNFRLNIEMKYLRYLG